MKKIAVDIMGGDFAPLEQIKGVELALDKYDDIELHLFGDEKIIKQNLKTSHLDRVKIYNFPTKVDMG